MRLIVLIVLALVIWAGYHLYGKKLLKQGRPGLMKLALVALGVIFVLLAITGRAHVLFGLIGALMTQIMRISPLLLRFMPLLQQTLNARKVFTPDSGRESRVTTTFLVMTLDHDTGNLDGEVIEGQFTGRRLTDLELDELRVLYSECARSDAEGMRLLHTFITRQHGPEWGEDEPGNAEQNHPTSPAIPPLAEAAEILGISADADRKTIVTAHRKLMGKLHPDKGGSNYLASKINAAKEVMLSSLPT